MVKTENGIRKKVIILILFVCIVEMIRPPSTLAIRFHFPPLDRRKDNNDTDEVTVPMSNYSSSPTTSIVATTVSISVAQSSQISTVSNSTVTTTKPQESNETTVLTTTSIITSPPTSSSTMEMTSTSTAEDSTTTEQENTTTTKYLTTESASDIEWRENCLREIEAHRHDFLNELPEKEEEQGELSLMVYWLWVFPISIVVGYSIFLICARRKWPKQEKPAKKKKGSHRAHAEKAPAKLRPRTMDHEKLDPKKFKCMGPLKLDPGNVPQVKHQLDGVKSFPIKKVEFADELNEINDIGSEVDVFEPMDNVSTQSKTTNESMGLDVTQSQNTPAPGSVPTKSKSQN